MSRQWPRLGALVALGLCVLVPGCQESETEEVETGYVGPARYNPFLAAERFLMEMGFDVRMDGTFLELPPDNGTMIAPLESFMNYGDAARVLNWVQHGGHLMLLLSGGEPWRNDWKYWQTAEENEKPDEHEPLDEEEKAVLDQLGVKLEEPQPQADTVVDARGRNVHADLSGGFTLAKTPFRKDVDGGRMLASFGRGFGRVTLVADAQPFRNKYLAKLDHAALLSELASLDRRLVISFVSSVKVSFWGMLWREGWMALICLAALLILWLWKNLPRFGPLLTADDRSARDFTGHLALAGAFLWRHRQVPALLQPLQQEVVALLARRGLNAEDPAMQQELATRCGLTADRVRLALFLVAPHSESVFLRAVQDLHTLRSKI